MGKKCGKFKFFQTVLSKIMVILIYLDDLDKNLNTAKSLLKSLDQEIKNFVLDTMDNLDGFQKLVLTGCEILILIGLNFRDPQA
jgi:hypothetical protein